MESEGDYIEVYPHREDDDEEASVQIDDACSHCLLQLKAAAARSVAAAGAPKKDRRKGPRGKGNANRYGAGDGLFFFRAPH